jgi:RNA polymerase sigma factor (sigma-70 family)
VNRSRSVLRHRIVPGDNPQQALPDTPDAEHGTLGLLGQPAARAALAGLPDRQREAIVLRYYAGLSQGEIAAAMGISQGAVNSHTAHGLSALRAALE